MGCVALSHFFFLNYSEPDNAVILTGCSVTTLQPVLTVDQKSMLYLLLLNSVLCVGSSLWFCIPHWDFVLENKVVLLYLLTYLSREVLIKF